HKQQARGRPAHFFQRADGDLIAFAGLWEAKRDPTRSDDPRAWLYSCTMITTRAGADMDTIHDRMPVVLEPDLLDVWLDPGDADRAELDPLLRPAPAGTLVHHRVSRRVGNVRNDDPRLIEEEREG
ncbi:MAG: SOS response-associated peptidase, partial [Solirubrobacteraceae bacterium]